VDSNRKQSKVARSGAVVGVASHERPIMCWARRYHRGTVWRRALLPPLRPFSLGPEVSLGPEASGGTRFRWLVGAQALPRLAAGSRFP
jgi:hypothetical protein